MISMVVAKGVVKEDEFKLEERVTCLKKRIRELNEKIRGKDYVDRIDRASR